MFKIFICKKNDTNIGEWVSLPKKDINIIISLLNVKYRDWMIIKSMNDELAIHIEKYQKESSYENLKSINMLARDYNNLNKDEKEMIKSLSREGTDFEELVSKIIDEKVRKAAQFQLDMLENMSEEDVEEYCKNLLSSMFGI